MHVVAVSWSGRYFTSRPCENGYGGTPSSLHIIFKGWSESEAIDLKPVLTMVQTWELWRKRRESIPW